MNANCQPGTEAALKIRLLPANAGQDMSFSDATTDRILQLARTDPSASASSAWPATPSGRRRRPGG